LYYENNSTLIYLLQELQQKKSLIIFSSSCTVYGQADVMPINENAAIKSAMSPYGNTNKLGRRSLQMW
jgi:UDP-glucose 4-epimerase